MRVVFVHGALVRDGAWWWHRVGELLSARGIPSIAPALPSCGETGLLPGHLGPGFVDDVVSVRAHLVDSDEPTVVVAHSYGGMVVAEAAHGLQRVEHLVYITSVLPLPGESLGSYSDEPAPWIDIDAEAGTFALRPEFAPGTYLQDCPEEVIAPAIERLTPQSVSVTSAETKVAAWQEIPSTYLVCTEDLGTPVELQREHAARADRSVDLAGGHHPFLSMPEEVLGCLLSL